MGLLASHWALESVIVALMRIAKAGEGSENFAAVKEARLALIDAARLRRELDADLHADQREVVEQHGVLNKIYIAQPD